MDKFNKKVSHLQQTIKEICADELTQLQEQGGIVVDSRTLSEYQAGHIENSIHIGRDYLEMRIEKITTDESTALIVVCQAGVRSLFAAESLINLGYKNVFSLAGGINAWQQCYPLIK